MNELFSEEEMYSPSPRLLNIKHLKENIGLETHYAPHMAGDGYVWSAWDRSNDPEGNGIPQDLEACGYGNSEDEAIDDLVRKMEAGNE